MTSPSHISPRQDELIAGQAIAPPFHVDVEPEREFVRVCPSGEIDIATTGTVRERIADLMMDGFRRILVDLRQATFLDSTGLHLMVDLDASSRTGGWRFAIIAGPAEVQRAFEVTGLLARLPFVDANAVTHGQWP
jgi:anti-anti-sigma factor